MRMEMNTTKQSVALKGANDKEFRNKMQRHKERKSKKETRKERNRIKMSL